jgi:hypothetical protein
VGEGVVVYPSPIAYLDPLAEIKAEVAREEEKVEE